MAKQYLYRETSRNPFAAVVRLSPYALRVGLRMTHVEELHLLAMADAYLRGQWLGGGGTERPLGELQDGTGLVPVTRVSGSSAPVRARHAAEFARALGGLAVRGSGGEEEVTRLAAHARAVEVPLWIARRHADTPTGRVAVAVDRPSVRVDVWADGAPTVRIRAPHGLHRGRRNPAEGLVLTVGDTTAELTADYGKWSLRENHVSVRLADRRWEVRYRKSRSSFLTVDGRPVAVLRHPDAVEHTPLLPLTDVEFLQPKALEPVDAVMAHALAVSFGIGGNTGGVRFRTRDLWDGDSSTAWGRSWLSGSGDGEGGGADGGAGGNGGDGGDGGGGGD